MKTKTSGAPLFTRDFTLVVIGQIISLFGNSILRFALPLYLLRQTGSAALFGVVSACAFLPMIPLSLTGGVLADRVNKRNIMVVLDFATAALVLLFSLLLGQSPLVPLMLATLMLLYGIQGTYQPAVQASIPALLDPSRILAGNAVINQISSLSGLVGPIVGGMLLASFGLGPILAVSIVCFFLSAVMELFIRIPHQPRKKTGSALAMVRADLADSFRFIRFQKPVLARVMVIAMLINLVLTSLLIVGLPVIVTQSLRLGDQWMGYCEAALAAGALLGGGLVALLGGKLSIRQTPLLIIVSTLCTFPVAAALALPIQTMTAYGIVLLFCALLMLCATAASIQLIAYIQIETPPELVGKVLSCLIAGSLCAQPLGQAIYGLLFQSMVPWGIILGASVASLLIGLYMRRVFYAADRPAEAGASNGEPESAA